MNATEQGLLHAIAHEPDDDTHRLVYADWLDDHGDEERAEFIRAQVRLAADRTESDHRRAVAFRARQLLDRHEAEWTGLRPGLALEWRFTRGFVESVLVHADSLEVLAAEGVFERLPLRSLGVLYLDGVDLLDHLPAVNSLRRLSLAGNPCGPDEVRYLARAPVLSRLRQLDLSFTLLDDVTSEELARLAWFQGLTHLGLGGNPITTPARRRLEANFGEALDFSWCREAEYLYTIRDPGEWGWFATGTVESDYQVFVHEDEAETRIALFDFEGNQLQVIRHKSRADRFSEQRQEQTETWLDRRGFVAGPIRVREVHLDLRHCLLDYPDWSLDPDTPDDPEWGNVIGHTRDWLESGSFVWRFDDVDFWLNRAGEVTDT